MKAIHIFLIITFALLHTSSVTQAQAPWSLQQCIAYAINNNIQLRQGNVAVALAAENLRNQRLQALPTLNGSASYGYFFGRNVDPTTYQFTNQTIATNQLGLNTNLNVWSAHRNKHTAKQLSYELQATQADQHTAANDMALMIAQAYLRVLLAKEQAKVASSYIALNQKQADQLNISYSYGAVPQSNLAESEAQLAIADANMQIAAGASSLALTNLKLLLDLGDRANFDIQIPDNADMELLGSVLLTNKNELVSKAESTQPQLQSRSLRIKSAEQNVALAKSYLYPTLTVFGGINTSYSNGARRIKSLRQSSEVLGYVLDTIPITYNNTIPEFEKNPYSNQLDQNLNKQIGVQLSVPIFNGGQVQSNIRKARMALLQQELALQADKVQLNKDITIAQQNAMNAKARYDAIEKKLQAVDKSFGFVAAKYQAKMATTLEYTTAQNNVYQAENELIQAKYEYIFQLKILEFYNGNGLK
jgi:outer membrane protein